MHPECDGIGVQCTLDIAVNNSVCTKMHILAKNGIFQFKLHTLAQRHECQRGILKDNDTVSVCSNCL